MRVKFVFESEAEIVLENAPADNVFISTFGLDINFELPA
jgi:hypothetical protein